MENEKTNVLNMLYEAQPLWHREPDGSIVDDNDVVRCTDLSADQLKLLSINDLSGYIVHVSIPVDQFYEGPPDIETDIRIYQDENHSLGCVVRFDFDDMEIKMELDLDFYVDIGYDVYSKLIRVCIDNYPEEDAKYLYPDRMREVRNSDGIYGNCIEYTVYSNEHNLLEMAKDCCNKARSIQNSIISRMRRLAYEVSSLVDPPEPETSAIRKWVTEVDGGSRQGYRFEIWVYQLFCSIGGLRPLMDRKTETCENSKAIGFRTRTGQVDMRFLTYEGIYSWDNKSEMIFVECKKTIKKSGVADFRSFAVKVLYSDRICDLGVFVSESGFTRGFLEEMDRWNSVKNHPLIYAISGSLLRNLGENSLDDLLTSCHKRALRARNGEIV